MRSAKVVEVNEAEGRILEQITRETSSRAGLVKRSQIILGAASGLSITAQSKALGMERSSVQKWRERWQAEQARRAAALETGTLREAIEETLADKPRSGVPVTFSAEQIVQIVAIACEQPETSGYPISHWTAKEVAHESIKRGIVPRISERQVGRFLKRG
jgi:putative transposase